MSNRTTPGVELTRVGATLFAVSDASGTRGFIEQAGPVYVSLSGTRYDRSVEIAQSLSLEHAADVVRSTGRSR